MNYRLYITSDPDIMLGKPIIRDTRITVALIIRKMSEGAQFRDLLEMYPHLTETHLLAALAYASDVLANEEIIRLSA